MRIRATSLNAGLSQLPPVASFPPPSPPCAAAGAARVLGAPRRRPCAPSCRVASGGPHPRQRGRRWGPPPATPPARRAHPLNGARIRARLYICLRSGGGCAPTAPAPARWRASLRSACASARAFAHPHPGPPTPTPTPTPDPRFSLHQCGLLH